MTGINTNNIDHVVTQWESLLEDISKDQQPVDPTLIAQKFNELKKSTKIQMKGFTLNHKDFTHFKGREVEIQGIVKRFENRLVEIFGKDTNAQDIIKEVTSFRKTLDQKVKSDEYIHFFSKKGKGIGFEKVIESFVDFFTKHIKEMISDKLFFGRNKKHCLDHLLGKRKEQEKKNDNLEKEISKKREEVDSFYNSKIQPLIDELNGPSMDFERFDQIDKQKNGLLEGGYKKLSNELAVLLEKLVKGKEEIDKIDRKIDNHKKIMRKGDETRKQLQSIGGERFKIEVEDKGFIDGMYLSSTNFKEMLANNGAQLYDMSFSIRGDASPTHIQGISIPENIDHKEFLDTLNSLGLASDNDYTETPPAYTMVRFKGKLLAMKTNEKQFLQNYNLIQTYAVPNQYNPSMLFYFQGIGPDAFTEVENFQFQENPIDLTEDTNASNGVVILSSGNMGVYEMHKKEMLSLLLKGVDVVGFNPRGYGLSEGDISDTNLKEDFEHIYSYLSESRSIPDEKMLFKSLCVTGGGASSLLKKHPHINLTLDQTYADVRILVEEEVKDAIDKFLRTNHLGISQSAHEAIYQFVSKYTPSLASYFAYLFAPKLDVSSDLQYAKGSVSILMTEGDSTLPWNKHLPEMLRKVAHNSKCSVLMMPGEHADSWNSSVIDLKLKRQDPKKSKAATEKLQKSIDNSMLKRYPELQYLYPNTKVVRDHNRFVKYPELKGDFSRLLGSSKRNLPKKQYNQWRDVEQILGKLHLKYGNMFGSGLCSPDPKEYQAYIDNHLKPVRDYLETHHLADEEKIQEFLKACEERIFVKSKGKSNQPIFDAIHNFDSFMQHHLNFLEAQGYPEISEEYKLFIKNKIVKLLRFTPVELKRDMMAFISEAYGIDIHKLLRGDLNMDYILKKAGFTSKL